MPTGLRDYYEVYVSVVCMAGWHIFTSRFLLDTDQKFGCRLLN